MVGSLRPVHVALAAQLVAFAPVWRWYAQRIVDGSDEPWGLVALITYLVAVFGRRPGIASSREISLVLPAALTAAYALIFPFVPDLVRGVVAVAALGSTVGAIRLGTPFHLPSLGLLTLSLPVMASLQFYLGYPLRIAAGTIASALLNLGGFSVALEGTGLRWGAELVSVDAPCSGVRMLWVALYLAFAAACRLNLDTLRTSAAATAAVMAVIAGNGIRATCLFHLEAGTLSAPEWCHDAVGVVVFAGLSVGLLGLFNRVGGRTRCAVSDSL